MTGVDAAPRAGGAAQEWLEDGSREARIDAVEELRETLVELLRTTVGLALDKVQQLASSFDVLTRAKGSMLGAVVGGLRAGAAGNYPIWGAFRGAVAAMSTGTRVALVLALVLAIVLLPVTVVLLLIALIVAIVVMSAKH